MPSLASQEKISLSMHAKCQGSPQGVVMSLLFDILTGCLYNNKINQEPIDQSQNFCNQSGEG
jgi:hypothetical protein